MRKSRFSFYTLNIKINPKPSDPEKEYGDLLKGLFDSRLKISHQSDAILFIRRLSDTTLEDTRVLSGLLSRTTDISGAPWINLDTYEDTKVELPKNVFPNLKEIEFVFFPELHKLAIKRDASFSVGTIMKYFREGLKWARKDHQTVVVDLVQSGDVFAEIFEAKRIKRLEISLSYSNDELFQEYGDFFDQQMKAAGVHSLEMIARPDSDENIKLDNQVFGGAMEAARTNGQVVASVVGANGRKKIVNTSQHPQVDQVVFEGDEASQKPIAVLSLFRRLYRNLK